MAPILLATVMHTGSLFTLDLLKNNYDCEEVPVTANVGDGLLAFEHLYEEKEANIRHWAGASVVVVPLRRPVKVVESFARRNERLSFLSSQLSMLSRLDRDFDISFLPIDSPRRDDFLAALGERLGVSLVTQWRPLNESMDPVPDGVEEGWQAFDWSVIQRVYHG